MEFIDIWFDESSRLKIGKKDGDYWNLYIGENIVVVEIPESKLRDLRNQLINL